MVGLITSAPAVIPTNPASEPFNIIERSGLLDKYQEKAIDPIIPPEAERVVVTKTVDTAPGLAERTDPPLNPYQPNQRRNTPIAVSGILCPFIG